MSDNTRVRGSEFLDKIEELGKRTGTKVTFKSQRGKGSHGTLYYGDKRTIVPDLKRELKTGTFYGMLRQLGINPKDLS
jgi:mRNA interferase HicA